MTIVMTPLISLGFKNGFYVYCLQNWCSWPDESFEEMDSTLAVQQFIQQMIAKDASCVDEILTPPDGQDEGVWKYEHLR